MRQIKCTTVIVMLLALMASAAFALDVGQPAPDFTLLDSNEHEVSLSEYAGKYVVLEWFNPECPFVRKHYDSGNMQSLQEKFTGQDVAWLSIDSSAEGNQGYLDSDDAKEFIEDDDVKSSAVLLDPTGKVGKLYDAKTTPHMFIIDPTGTLIYQGAIDDAPSADSADIETSKNYVDETLNLALAGERVEAFSTKSYGCSVKY